MNDTHCYNDECINAVALKNCTHKECEGKEIFPAFALLNEDVLAYCSKECKARVVMPDYNPKTAPKTVKEMQYRVAIMKKEYLDRMNGSQEAQILEALNK